METDMCILVQLRKSKLFFGVVGLKHYFLMQSLQQDRAEGRENTLMPFLEEYTFDLLLGRSLYDCQLEFLLIGFKYMQNRLK